MDQFDRITPEALYGSMQDAGIAHSAACNLSGKEFLDMGYAWMLNRIHFVIDTLPTLLDKLTIQTWAFNLSGLYAIREYRVLNEANEDVVRGTSRWLVIDVTKKRAIRIPEIIEKCYGINSDRGLEDSFEKLQLDISCDQSIGFQVRWSDLDSNRHANSARYFDWCVDALPHDLLDSATLAEFELEYKKELLLDDASISRCMRQDHGHTQGHHFAHQITMDDSETLVAQARSRWI